jgi:predicted MFS family arabinose efflux permease
LLVEYDWHAVFLFGAAVTAAMIPLIAWLVPETPAFHATRRKQDALERINRSLRALSQPAMTSLPPLSPAAAKLKVSDILSKPGLRKVTWLLALGYMFLTLTFYYILKFTVVIVKDSNSAFTQGDGADVLMWANIGGAAGGLLFGFVMKKLDVKGPTIGALLLGVGAVAYFGIGHGTLDAWRVAAFFTMFCLNAAIVGYYAAFARGFPAYARGTGTGFVLGIGRAGAATSPLLAGYLFKTMGNSELLTVSLIMTGGAIVSAVLIWMLPLRDADRDLEDV